MLHPQDRPRRTLNSEGYPWLAPRAPSAAPHGRRAPRVLAGPAYRRSARVLSPRSAATALVSRIESSSSGKVRLDSSTRRRAYRFGCLFESRTSWCDRELWEALPVLEHVCENIRGSSYRFLGSAFGFLAPTRLRACEASVWKHSRTQSLDKELPRFQLKVSRLTFSAFQGPLRGHRGHREGNRRRKRLSTGEEHTRFN